MRRHLSYVTCQPTQVNMSRLTPARKAGARFTYPGGMEGWVDLGGWLHTEMVYPPTWSPIQVLTGPDYIGKDQPVTAEPPDITPLPR